MRLLSWTQNERHNIATYILKTVGLTLIGALLIGVGVSALMPDATQPDVGDVTVQPWLVFFGVVVLSPILETLMMWPIIAGIRWALPGKSVYLIAVLSAGVWAGMHSLAAPIWGAGDLLAVCDVLVELFELAEAVNLARAWHYHGVPCATQFGAVLGNVGST